MGYDKLTDSEKADIRKWVGGLIRLHRTRAGYTAVQLAEATGTSRQYYPEAEGGRQLPSIYVLSQMCRVLGIGLQDFFGGSSAPTSSPITAEEMSLLAKYRACSLREKAKINDLLDLLIDRS